MPISLHAASTAIWGRSFFANQIGEQGETNGSALDAHQFRGTGGTEAVHQHALFVEGTREDRLAGPRLGLGKRFVKMPRAVLIPGIISRSERRPG
jgi:hypothetical protein